MKPEKHLAGVMTTPSEHKMGEGLTLVYVHTEVIAGQRVDVATFRHINEALVEAWVPRSLGRKVLAHGFQVALKAAKAPLSELVRVAQLVREGM